MRAIISRIVAPVVAVVVAWLAGLGLELGGDFETALTETVTLLLLAVAMAAYGVVHKLVDRFVNPGDTAE